MDYNRWSLVSLAVFIVGVSFTWLAYLASLDSPVLSTPALQAKPFTRNTSNTELSLVETSHSLINSTGENPERNRKTDEVSSGKEENALQSNAGISWSESTNGQSNNTTKALRSQSAIDNDNNKTTFEIGNTTMLESETRIFQANETKPYMTVKFKGRLGNQMLQYAALFAITRRNSSWTPVIVPRGRCFRIILDAFEDSLSIKLVNFQLEEEYAFWESVDADETIEQLRDLPAKNVTLYGYFQSHKFFDDVKYELRKEFTFPNRTRADVFSYFESVTPAGWRNESFVRVGIHVRRASLLKPARRAMGFVERPPSYYANAMEYFTNKYERVEFVVASHDLAWCRANIRGRNVVYSQNDAAHDMAILSHCDHVITSLGTYSWWAGWLCQGTTIYYSVMPPDGTYLAMIYANNKWVPPPDDDYNHWLPIV